MSTIEELGAFLSREAKASAPVASSADSLVTALPNGPVDRTP
jgi:hypothetical protein